MDARAGAAGRAGSSGSARRGGICTVLEEGGGGGGGRSTSAIVDPSAFTAMGPSFEELGIAADGGSTFRRRYRTEALGELVPIPAVDEVPAPESAGAERDNTDRAPGTVTFAGVDAPTWAAKGTSPHSAMSISGIAAFRSYRPAGPNTGASPNTLPIRHRKSEAFL